MSRKYAIFSTLGETVPAAWSLFEFPPGLWYITDNYTYRLAAKPFPIVGGAVLFLHYIRFVTYREKLELGVTFLGEDR